MLCKKCNSVFGCHSCPTCRRNERSVAKGLPLGNCKECCSHTYVSFDSLCRPCMKKMNLRECKECKQSLIIDISFARNSYVCLECKSNNHNYSQCAICHKDCDDKICHPCKSALTILDSKTKLLRAIEFLQDV